MLFEFLSSSPNMGRYLESVLEIKNRTDKLRMMKQCDMEEFGVEQFKGRS